MSGKYIAIEHTTEVTVFTINKYRIVSLPLDRMVLQDIKSNYAVKNSLDICSANDEMPYSGQLNTIQKEMPQLLLIDSSPSSSLLPESSLLLLAFVFFFSTIAAMHEKNIQYTHGPLKPIPSFFSAAIYFLCLNFQCKLPSQHTLEISLSMEKPQTISKNFL